MSNKFKIGDRVRLIVPSEERDTIGKILSFEYCKITCNYIYCFEEELTKEIFHEYGSFFKLIDKYPNKTEPSHYKNQSIETIEMMVRIWGAKAVVLFCEINAFKYRMRVGSKEGESIEDDIKKAQWYEQRANELRDEK